LLRVQYPRDVTAGLLARLHAGGGAGVLPDEATLGSLLDIAFTASLEPEENRFATFGLGFVPPGVPSPPYREVRFAEPVALSTRGVANLAAATDSIRTTLALWPGGEDGLQIWGLVTARQGSAGTGPAQEHATYLPHAPFFLVRVRAPGVLYVYHQHVLRLLYVRGETYDSPSGQLQEILRDTAGLAPAHARAVSDAAARISLLEHGGTILLTDPAAPLPPGLLDVSYRLTPAATLVQEAVAEPAADQPADPAQRSAERHALDFIARLSQIDGAVHLTTDLALEGFGAKIMSTGESFALYAEDPSGANRRALPLSTIPGTRHRSAASFCAQQTGRALAIVVSQDGDVSLFRRLPDGAVLRIGPFALGTGLTVGG
jgi:hypothetical protein